MKNQNKMNLLALLLIAAFGSQIHLSKAFANDASSSKQIEATSGFGFNTYRQIQFMIQVPPLAAENDEFSKVSISIVDESVISIDDPLLEYKEKLFTARPNAEGNIYQAVYLPNLASKLLVETHINGENVHRLVDLYDQESIAIDLVTTEQSN